MKKKLSIILGVLLILSLLFTGCKKDEFSRDEIIKQSKILDWMEVLGQITENPKSEKNYKNVWYAYSGKINTIEKECIVLTDLVDLHTDMKVFLNTEDIKPLKIDDVVHVVGRFEVPSSKEMKDAILLTKEEVNKSYVVQLFRQEGTGTESSYSYYDYVYDKEKKQVVEYYVRGNENGKYTLTYDEKGRLLSSVLDTSAGPFTRNYTYWEDGTMQTLEHVESEQLYLYKHEMGTGGKIAKTTSINIANDDYTTVHEYTYNSAGLLVKETQTSEDVKSTITYEYDQYDLLHKESKSSTAGDATITYIYILIAKK